MTNQQSLLRRAVDLYRKHGHADAAMLQKELNCSKQLAQSLRRLVIQELQAKSA